MPVSDIRQYDTPAAIDTLQDALLLDLCMTTIWEVIREKHHTAIRERLRSKEEVLLKLQNEKQDLLSELEGDNKLREEIYEIWRNIDEERRRKML